MVELNARFLILICPPWLCAAPQPSTSSMCTVPPSEMTSPYTEALKVMWWPLMTRPSATSRCSMMSAGNLGGASPGLGGVVLMRMEAA